MALVHAARGLSSVEMQAVLESLHGVAYSISITVRRLLTPHAHGCREMHR